MLVRFNFNNYKSYRDNNEFSMLAGRVRKYSHHLLNTKKSKLKLLRLGLLYGKNASGKSNFVKAINTSKNIIIQGLKQGDLYNKHFRLNKKYFNKSTTFQYELLIEDKLYSYGFTVQLNKNLILKEWLYELKKDSEKKIFERNNDKDKLTDLVIKDAEISKKYHMYLSDASQNEEKLILKELQDKSIANNSELKIIKQIYFWFKEKLIILYPDSHYEGINYIGENNDLNDFISQILDDFDTGITKIISNRVNFEDTFSFLPADLKNKIINDVTDKKHGGVNLVINDNLFNIEMNNKGEVIVAKIGLQHFNNENEIFDTNDESDGTKRLLDILPLIYSMKKSNLTVIVDEINRSLHPNLTVEFIKRFLKHEDMQSQLIVSTHEIGLMNLNLVRRDEIWFIDQDNTGASSLKSLDMFKERFDKKVGLAYLVGRYNGIPNFKS
ncbi:ATP-binding protein [bacterium]|nr:ATP-binding protein [Bacteroidales bacterium]MCK5684048.1 ATP-binding protein [bacterium]